MREALRRVWFLFRQRQAEADLTEEIEFHIKMKEAELRAGGVPDREAAQLARREMGGIAVAKEAAREVWVRPWLETAWQDVRYAARMLRRQPGFSAVGIAILAIAIALNASLFTVFNGLAIRPWSGVADARRVVMITTAGSTGPGVSGFSLNEYRYFAARAKSFKRPRCRSAKHPREQRLSGLRELFSSPRDRDGAGTRFHGR